MKANKFIKRAAALLLAAALIFCASCTKQDGDTDDETVSRVFEFSSINSRGNTNGNIANIGMGVAQGDKIFFTNPCAEWYTFTLENGEVKKVFDDLDDIFVQMNMIDSNLYYISYYYEDMCFYDINGGIPGSLADIATYALIVYDDYLYAIDASDGYVKRWKFNSETTDGEQLGEHKAYLYSAQTALTMSVTDDYVYYAAVDDDYNVYRVSLADKTEQKIVSSKVSRLIVENGLVYYVLEEDGKLYSCNSDGSDVKCLSQRNIAAFNVNEKYVYYSSAEEGLFKIPFNGGEETKISDLQNIAYINLMNEYLFVYSGVEGEVIVATSKLLKENGEEIGSWTATTADESSSN